MRSPKISVIVPVYNAEKWLRRCVDSILAQTFADFELLLVDDGSTDAGGDICDEYARRDARIRVFHKPNGGASSARNVGLDNALGEWVTFCDADDLVYPDWLNNFSPEDNVFDLKCQGLRTDRPLAISERELPGRTYAVEYTGTAKELFEVLLQNDLFGYTVLKLFRNSIIRKFGLRFDTYVRLCEDELFVMQYFLHADRCMSVKNAGYFYYVPDWHAKYSRSDEEILYLFKRQADYCATLFSDDATAPVVRFFRDKYTNSLIDSFARKPKPIYLGEIRRMHKDDYGCSRLFVPLKWLIVRDRTCILSWPALLIHSNLRLLRKKQ